MYPSSPRAYSGFSRTLVFRRISQGKQLGSPWCRRGEFVATQLLRRRSGVGLGRGAKEAFDRFRHDVEFVGREKRRLLEQYPEEWIAIFQGKVVAHHKDLEQLIRALNAKNVSPEDAVVDFITRREQVLVL